MIFDGHAYCFPIDGLETAIRRSGGISSPPPAGYGHSPPTRVAGTRPFLR